MIYTKYDSIMFENKTNAGASGTIKVYFVVMASAAKMTSEASAET